MAKEFEFIGQRMWARILLYSIQAILLEKDKKRYCNYHFFFKNRGILHFLSELCGGKAMVANTQPQQRKKEESERLRGERDKIKFIDHTFERWQVV